MTPDSRNLYRNHEKTCPRPGGGRKYKKCRCPIWVDFSFAGERICESLHTRNWQKAEDLLRKWEADDLSAAKEAQLPRISDPPNAPPVRHTLEAACTAFLAEAETRGLREPTLYKYRLLFRRLQAFTRDLGLLYVAEMNLQILRDFRATWPHRNTAARKRLEELRAFFRFCQDSGWIPNNPAKSLQPPIDTSAPAEPFTDGEVEKIRAACAVYPGVGRTHQDHAQRLRALVEVMLHTGLRIRDAVTLRRDCIVDGKVRVRTEKTGTVVCCPLPPSLIQKLGAIRGTSSQYFFWSGTSKPKSAVGDYQRSLKKLFKLAGVSGGHAHRFRHTFAKSLFLARVPVEDIAVLMGHRNPAITLKHYSAWVPERQEQLEANIMRVWAEKDRPKKREKPPKRPESAIQPLYGNHPDWLN